MPKSVVAAWRDAVRDSGLDKTAKLVAHTLSTYMNGAGTAFPSKATLARGASLKATRAVDTAIKRLEAEGFLAVDRSVGGTSSNLYRALIPLHLRAGEGGTGMQGRGASTNGHPRMAMQAPLHGDAPKTGFESEMNATADLKVPCTTMGCNGTAKHNDGHEWWQLVCAVCGGVYDYRRAA